MTVREKTNTSTLGQTAARIMMLERAAGHIGQKPLAEAMGIGVRALQYKLAVGRGVTDTDMRLAADALDQHVATTAKLANAIREATW